MLIRSYKVLEVILGIALILLACTVGVLFTF